MVHSPKRLVCVIDLLVLVRCFSGLVNDPLIMFQSFSNGYLSFPGGYLSTGQPVSEFVPMWSPQCSLSIIVHHIEMHKKQVHPVVLISPDGTNDRD